MYGGSFPDAITCLARIVSTLHDERGNVLFGDAFALDCERCVVVGDGGTAAAMGLRDMVVVHADGATLTCRLSDSDQVRRVSEAVRARGTP